MTVACGCSNDANLDLCDAPAIGEGVDPISFDNVSDMFRKFQKWKRRPEIDVNFGR
jgi:hypothetical protein